MAWITEQALADYLNWYPDRDENTNLLRSLLDANVVFTMGSLRRIGIDEVMKEFSEMSDAISCEFGFVARPVCGKEPLPGNHEQYTIRKAVALCSKMEPYISWLFFIVENKKSGKIERIDSVMGSQYHHPLNYDLYELKQSCKEK